MRKNLAWTAAAATLLCPLAARAQVVDGFYIGAGVGPSLLQTETILNLGTLEGVATPAKPKIKFDVGVAGVASVGYGYGNGLRAEIEAGIRDNTIHAIGGGGVRSGSSDKYSVMVNGFYDLDLHDYYGIDFMTPYVGAGIGYAYEQLDGFNGLIGGNSYHSNSGTNALAYQGIVGVAFPLTDLVPGLSLTTEYRFFGTAGNAKYFVGANPGNKAGAGRVKVGDDLNHSFLFGVRYAFGEGEPAVEPAPMPVTAPAPQPSRTYLVFFDWDRAELTARAKQIIADAAANAGRVSYTRIEVNGHADRSGTPQYNQALSVRRARAVADELVHDGVRQTMIDIHGYGDTKPLVPTAAGVREPQNRRVEIVIK